MADTKEFDVVRVARSDGADTGPGYWPISTAPSSAAVKKAVKDPADRPTRAKPQMVRLAEDDPRFVEWRVKLGILLKQELSPSPDEGHAWYVQFPRGYWLYEKSKHLWVSGYPIKAKLFKSPQEFGLHLIWLLSASMDYKDCCCVHCNTPTVNKPPTLTDDAQSPAMNEYHPVADKTPFKVTPVPLPTIPGQPVSQPSNPASRPTSHTPPTATAKPQPQPVYQASSAAVQPIAQPHPTTQPQLLAQPQPMSQQQPMLQQQPMPQQQPQNQTPNVQPQPTAQVPSQAPPLAKAPPQIQPKPETKTPPQFSSPPTRWTLQSPPLFRIGELVWYQNGPTWRLGVIAAQSSAGHEVLPIGHAMIPQPNVAKLDRDMRPFLAFSVPPVTLPELKDKTFDEIPWEALFQATANDPGRRDVLTLDASKMAASKTDYSFSLWSPATGDPNSKTTAYYGCFLGAERIGTGDCLRLRALPADFGIPGDSAILGLQWILTSKDHPGAVFFRGHVYVPIGPDATAVMATPEENLPPALREECKWRMQVNAAQATRWRLVKENVAIKEQYIRGRFYPTHRLMPILNPAGFQNAVAQRQISNQYAQLNTRMDGTSSYTGQRKNRLETLGHAVSRNASLSFEAFVREEPLSSAAPGMQT